MNRLSKTFSVTIAVPSLTAESAMVIPMLVALTGLLIWGLMAAAAQAKPTPDSELRRVIDDMRHYLKKMHGRDRPPVILG